MEFALAVPFERFGELKSSVEQRRRWPRLNGRYSFFEQWWAPKSWAYRYRFVFSRARYPQRATGPVQLDLFQPGDPGDDFRAVITNKSVSARKVLRFYHGRATQEGVFAELKSQIHPTVA